MISKFFGFLILFSFIFVTVAYDPDALQDLCVADHSSGAKVNGFTCKAEANVTVSDFFFAGMAKPAAINSTVGSAVTLADVVNIAGLNTLGISLGRADYAPGGLLPPHVHPRASEIFFVLEGELDVGFVTTANKLFTKTVKKGEVFAIPRGLIHFQKNNNREKPASIIAAFNSQSPGLQSIAAALFTATPAVPDNVLKMAFQIGTEEVEKIRSKLAP